MNTKKVRIDPKRPGMLVREDDPSAGYLIGVEAASVARAINHHDALTSILREVDQYLSGHPQNAIHCGSKLHRSIQKLLRDAAK